MMKAAILAAAVGLGMGLTACATPAQAGEWRLDPWKCPDLVEDRIDRAENRRDRRVTYGPIDRLEDLRDRREDRRDRAVVHCPRRAFYWSGPHRTARWDGPDRVGIYWHPRGYWYRHGPRRSVVRVNIAVR